MSWEQELAQPTPKQIRDSIKQFRENQKKNRERRRRASEDPFH